MALDVDRCSYEPYVIIPRQGKSYLEEGGEGNNEKDLMKRKSCYATLEECDNDNSNDNHTYLNPIINNDDDDLRRKNSYQETGVHCPPLAGPLPLVSSADMQSWATSHDDDDDVVMMVMMVVVVALAVVMIMLLICSSSAGVQSWGTNHDDADNEEGDQEQENGDYG